MISEKISTPITHSCDVLVAGGGFAGISAALAAARQGKRVILLERQYVLGGLGTAGLVTIYLPLCDGMGHQVSFGIAEELFKLSIKYGIEDRFPYNWLDENGIRDEKSPRYEAQYNPHFFAISAEQLLIENGVKILYGTYAVATNCEDGRIKAVIVENKSGRSAIEVGSVVDATGDCDIAHFSGAPTEINKQGNVLAAWYYSLSKAGYDLNMVGIAPTPLIGDIDKLPEGRFYGIDADEMSEVVIRSHAWALADMLKKREMDETAVPTLIASIPQVRMTRRIVGEYTLSDDEMHKYFEDSIGMVSDWRKRGPVYEVPFSTLYSSKVKNLICAGRCTSVEDGDMWDIMRVIPCCAVTGEAAGTAAAMTDDFSNLNIAELQSLLRKNGVILHENEL